MEEATRGNMFLDNKRLLVRHIWYRTFATTKAYASNSILSGQSEKSSSAQGINIPSTTGQNGNEMLPNNGHIYDHEGTLPTENLHLSSASIKIKSVAIVTTDLQHSLKGVQGGDKK